MHTRTTWTIIPAMIVLTKTPTESLGTPKYSFPQIQGYEETPLKDVALLKVRDRFYDPSAIFSIKIT
jgi:hypothetical protein